MSGDEQNWGRESEDANPQYWYARSGDSALGRMSYSPVHWKGFVALFVTIFGCIGILLVGVLMVVFVLSNVVVSENGLTKLSIIAFGVITAFCAFKLAIYAFRTLRKRVDPVNNATWYRKKFFGM